MPLRLSDVLSDVLAIARASKSAALSIAPGPPGMGGIGGAPPPPPPPPPPSMARRSSPLGAVPGGADPRGERAGMTPPLPPLRAPMRPAPGMGGPIPGGGPGDDPAPAPPKKAARGSPPPAKIPDAPPPIGDGARCSFRLPVDECSECVIDAGERRLPSDASKNPSSAEPSPPPRILLPPPALPLVVRGMRCRATGGDGFAGEPPPAPPAPPTPSIAINPAAPPAAGGGAVRDCDCDCVCGGGGPSRIPGGAPRNPCCCCCCCAGIPPLPPNRGSPPAIELTCFSSMRSASKNASDDAADVAAVAAAACAAFAPRRALERGLRRPARGERAQRRGPAAMAEVYHPRDLQSALREELVEHPRGPRSELENEGVLGEIEADGLVEHDSLRAVDAHHDDRELASGRDARLNRERLRSLARVRHDAVRRVAAHGEVTTGGVELRSEEIRVYRDPRRSNVRSIGDALGGSRVPSRERRPRLGRGRKPEVVGRQQRPRPRLGRRTARVWCVRANAFRWRRQRIFRVSRHAFEQN